MQKEDLDAKFKNPDDPLRLVFVCAMWITGFDVPTCRTIYLDKPMKNHTLMQTIARANRGHRARPRASWWTTSASSRTSRRRWPSMRSAAGVRRGRFRTSALVVELAAAIEGALAFCRERGVEPQRILEVTGFERLARLGELRRGPQLGTHSWNAARSSRMRRTSGPPSRRCFRTRALKPYRMISAAIEVTAERIRALAEKPGHFRDRLAPRNAAGRVDRGRRNLGAYSSGGDVEGLFDLSRLDIERLRGMFATSQRQRTETQRLRRAVEEQLGGNGGAQSDAPGPRRAIHGADRPIIIRGA